MEKRKTKKTETPAKTTSAPRPANEKEKNQTAADQVEELFGVHIISDADIENHFGATNDKRASDK